MLVKHSHILEAREVGDNNVILCHIQIGKRSIKYYSGQPEAHTTHRWMKAEDWAKFDEYLESVVGSQHNITTNTLDRLKEHTFQLNQSIYVYVSKCSISIDVLKRSILADTNKWNVTHALEFRIEYIHDGKTVAKQKDNSTEKYFSTLNSNGEDPEYNPSYISTELDTNTHVPYTPSPKVTTTDRTGDKSIPGTPDITISRPLHDEERYSPKPISLKNNLKKSPKSPQLVPTYKPSPVKQQEFESTCKNSISEIKNVPSETSNDNDEENGNRRKKKKANKIEKNEINAKENIKIREEYRKDRSERKTIIEKVKDKTQKNEGNKAKENICDSIIDVHEGMRTVSCRVTLRDERRKRNLDDESKSTLRRSSRSPVKTKRFMEQQVDVTRSRSNSPSPKRQHKKLKNEDLFGSEDDDYDNSSGKSDKDPIEKELKRMNKHVSHKAEKSSSSAKKKRTSNTTTLSNDGTSLEKWLGKKLTMETSSSPSLLSKHKDTRSKVSARSVKNRKPHRDECSSPTEKLREPAVLSYPSKEEIEMQMQKEKLQIEKNEKVKEALQQLAGPTPEKVDTLTIEDLSLSEVLASFRKYKSKLDEIFCRNARKPHQIKGYNGINHYLVMNLIHDKKRMSMLDTLRDAYEPDSEGSSTFATLFINAMMPEWIIHLFMDKHKLSREEAIKQIKAQDAYNLHLEAQLESSTKLEDNSI